MSWVVIIIKNKLHYETSNPIFAFMETIVHAIQDELYVEAKIDLIVTSRQRANYR